IARGAADWVFTEINLRGQPHMVIDRRMENLAAICDDPDLIARGSEHAADLGQRWHLELYADAFIRRQRDWVRKNLGLAPRLVAKDNGVLIQKADEKKIAGTQSASGDNGLRFAGTRLFQDQVNRQRIRDWRRIVMQGERRNREHRCAGE